MDNFLLQAIVTELESLLVGGRLGKAYQSGTTDLALDFRLRDGRWLMVSTDPRRLAIYLTPKDPRQTLDEPRLDTAFVSLLKKYLSGARLIQIEKLGYDRVVTFDFVLEHTEISPTASSRRTLVVMLTGRAANVLLVENGHVLASLREKEETRYTEPKPPADKLDPIGLSPETFDKLIEANDGNVALAAQKNLIGFSPLFAEELRFRSQSEPAHQALQNLLAEIFDGPHQPILYSSASIDELEREIGREEFSLTLSPIRLRHLESTNNRPIPLNDGTITSPPEGVTLNSLADQYFSLLDERRRFLASKQTFQSALKSRLKKQQTLIANLQRELAGFANAELHQRYGELLLANLHQASMTEAGFEVTNFYDEAQPKIFIPSAAKATAQDAAEHYFKLARKSRHGREAISKRLPELEHETSALEKQIADLESVTRADELKILAEKFHLAPLTRRAKMPQPSKKVREEKLTGIRRYRSSDGFEILVGRTDRDNDNLTFRIAKSFDLWFHAADYPGSHVVLRNPQRKPPPSRAIAEAAQLAAKFSHARTNPKVAVNYCERKFVTKMKGFAPGQVRLSSFKTVMVEPAEAGERI